MDGNCNAGTVLLRQKGWYKNVQVWLNEQGIVSLLSIPMLEDVGYKVSTHTDHDWTVTIMRGEVIVFKQDTGICKGMPNIDLRGHAKVLVVIETAQKNMEMFTEKEIEQVKLVRAVQRRIGHPTDEHLRNIVSQQSVKNTPIRSPDKANAKVLFGPSVAGLKGWSTRGKKTGDSR